MRNNIRRIVEEACDRRLERMSFLPGGSVGEVWKLDFEGNFQGVLKIPTDAGALHIEGEMLSYLKNHSNLSIPKVILSRSDLILLEWIENDNIRNPMSDEHAADELATLHKITSSHFGFHRDTLIGSLSQINTPSPRWIPFFRDNRLMYMGVKAHEIGHIETSTLHSLEKLCAGLDQFITEPKRPSLLHGDIWTGNVLFYKGKIAAFIDPAIYYGHQEIDVAYSSLFDTFGDRFFQRYNEHYTLDKHFYDVRLPIYHLYPLLVHAVLFGGNYGNEVDAIISRFIR